MRDLGARIREILVSALSSHNFPGLSIPKYSISLLVGAAWPVPLPRRRVGEVAGGGRARGAAIELGEGDGTVAADYYCGVRARWCKARTARPLSKSSRLWGECRAVLCRWDFGTSQHAALCDHCVC